MNNIEQSTSLFFKEGTSDKVYNVTLEKLDSSELDYVVNFSYGRRGSSLKSGTKTDTPVSFYKASNIYNSLVSKKTSEGYISYGTIAPTFIKPVSDNKATGLFPQLLTPIDKSELEFYICNPNYMIQEKIDGVRMMVSVRNDVVTASNRRNLIVPVESELEKELSFFGSFAKTLVLDGELVGDTYCVFDLLEYNGVNLRDISAKSRYEKLEYNLKTFINVQSSLNGRKIKYLQIVECSWTSEEEKRALVKKMLHKEGVVIKDINSTSMPGITNTQMKCKFWDSCTAQVMGINQKRSISVGVMKDGAIANVGNVTVPPNYELPEVGALVEVKYLYFHVGGSLYQPIYLGVRDDIVHADEYDSLKPKAKFND